MVWVVANRMYVIPSGMPTGASANGISNIFNSGVGERM